MSLLLNGNDFKNQTHIFKIEDQSHIGEVRRFAANLSERLEFSEIRRGRVGIIITEFCTNLLKYASGGQILIRACSRSRTHAIEMISVDSGPGIQNTEGAMKDGFSTGTSPGNGLGAIQRQSDEFDIYSNEGQGTLALASVYARDDHEKFDDRIGAVNFPIKGEDVCGDAWCISGYGNDLNILVTDGLGHGPEAHKASAEALDEFDKNHHRPVALGLEAIHGRLRGTRGAAVFMARWAERKSITYAAVGNIRGIILGKGPAKVLITQNGTAGVRIPRIKTYEQPWNGEGALIFHSDGIKSHWNLDAYPGILNHHPALVAALIFKNFSRQSDDATVVVIGRNL